MTEKTIIERVARALSVHHLQGEGCWQDFADDVRVVLTAIREPSAAMIEAGLSQCAADWRESVCREFLPDIWKAMIDAAFD
jgi:hypothetical protein